MPRAMTWIIQIIATGFLLGFLFTVIRAAEFRRDSRAYPGVVTGLEPNDGTWYGWVEYVWEDGVKRKLRSSVSSSPPAFEVGERVTVRVARDGSGERIDSFSENWFVSMILGIFALFWSGFGFGPALFSAYKARRASA
jgi:hypothetical protein